MLVRRKGSNKKKRRLYEALEFRWGSSGLKEVTSFLGNLGKIEIDYKISNMWIETEDGRKIGVGQFLLKDDRREKILSFDPTIFYDWFDIWRKEAEYHECLESE